MVLNLFERQKFTRGSSGFQGSSKHSIAYFIRNRPTGTLYIVLPFEVYYNPLNAFK